MIAVTGAKSCPFCQSPDTWFWEPGPGMKAVACGNKACNATGPIAVNEDYAVMFWNRAPRRGTDAA